MVADEWSQTYKAHMAGFGPQKFVIMELFENHSFSSATSAKTSLCRCLSAAIQYFKNGIKIAYFCS